ncbi:MAG: DMT family transporter [Lachnospiraceae bacterium]|nr:DMT family transporter [Ruminococcus sp.]MCM1274730.1 DMT family transporter [Lachnospiraceae bacterium]
MESNKRRAVLLIILSAFFFAVMNMFVSLSGDVPVVQKMFFRNLFAMLIASGAMIKNRHYILPKKGERADILLRSLFGLLGMFGNFYALSRLAVADASLLNKMSPFFAVIFSAALLGERPDRWQTVCVLTAFFGAMFVLKPSFHNADLLPSCAGFLGGACAGLAYTFVRKLTGGGTKGYYIVFFFSAFSTLCTLPVMLFGYSPMTWGQLLCLLGAGAAAAGGQFAITAAYSRAPAREVSIYDYSQIIFAAALGFAVMGQIPDVWSFVGYFIIIGAAFAMFKYNNRKTK